MNYVLVAGEVYEAEFLGRAGSQDVINRFAWVWNGGTVPDATGLIAVLVPLYQQLIVRLDQHYSLRRVSLRHLVLVTRSVPIGPLLSIVTYQQQLHEIRGPAVDPADQGAVITQPLPSEVVAKELTVAGALDAARNGISLSPLNVDILTYDVGLGTVVLDPVELVGLNLAINNIRFATAGGVPLVPVVVRRRAAEVSLVGAPVLTSFVDSITGTAFASVLGSQDRREEQRDGR